MVGRLGVVAAVLRLYSRPVRRGDDSSRSSSAPLRSSSPRRTFTRAGSIAGGCADREPEDLSRSNLLRVELEILTSRDAPHLDRAVVAEDFLDSTRDEPRVIAQD